MNNELLAPMGRSVQILSVITSLKVTVNSKQFSFIDKKKEGCEAGLCFSRLDYYC